jgi:hypothetical protein
VDAARGAFRARRTVFLPASAALRGVVIVESPPAFRSRLIFTRAEPLARARFPRDAVRAQVPLAWPPPDESGQPAPA